MLQASSSTLPTRTASVLYQGLRLPSTLAVTAPCHRTLQGVDTVFAYPGGASMEIHQALTRSETIDNILCRHEQVRPHHKGKQELPNAWPRGAFGNPLLDRRFVDTA